MEYESYPLLLNKILLMNTTDGLDGNNRARVFQFFSYLPVSSTPIWPMVQMEGTAQEIFRLSNIYFCGQRTNTTDESDENRSARERF